MTVDALKDRDPRAIGKRLQTARTACGKTQQEAADFLGVARTTVTAIEKGERRIQAGELARLAGLYGRSLGELLRPGEPVEAFTESLRSALPPDPALAAEIGPALLELQRLCEDYLELERIRRAPLPRRYPSLYETGGVTPALAAEDIATAERNRLGLGDGPLPNLREFLETDVGVRTFYLDLPQQVVALYAFTDSIGACVAANRRHSEVRRRLAIAHEYGHFLTQRFRAEVTLVGRPERQPKQERLAETFSRAFLIPAAGLRRRFHEIYRSRKGSLTPADIYRLAHLYSVPFEAMTLRLQDLKLLTAGTLGRLQRSSLPLQEESAMEPHSSPGEIVPLRYLFLAVEAFEQGDLSEGQLTRLLRVDRVEARRLAERYSGVLEPLRSLGAA
ncbi:MAG: XRE family transcriptional regulator [Thermoanaerobaculia bacterium]